MFLYPGRVALTGTLLGLNLLLSFSPDMAHGKDLEHQIQLGAQLFFDARLSADDQMSCATCHKPELGFTDGLPLARGYNGKLLNRHTPTLLHLADNIAFFWDGRVSSLEKQILSVIQHPDEMNMDLKSLISKLNQVPDYVNQFQTLYGTDVTVQGIALAISAFERTLVTRRAPINRYLSGDEAALNTSAKRGLKLYQGKAHCAQCHSGLNFTDSKFHNLGVPSLSSIRGKKYAHLKKDLGRYDVTFHMEDRGAFKTPTLRNISQTAPYMHNGVFDTLEEVMEFYNRGGGNNPNLDMQMKPLKLTAEEIKDVIEFMKALTGDLPKINRPPLPGMK